jgi:hypothetical protein
MNGTLFARPRKGEKNADALHLMTRSSLCCTAVCRSFLPHQSAYDSALLLEDNEEPRSLPGPGYRQVHMIVKHASLNITRSHGSLCLCFVDFPVHRHQPAVVSAIASCASLALKLFPQQVPSNCDGRERSRNDEALRCLLYWLGRVAEKVLECVLRRRCIRRSGLNYNIS